MISLSISKPVNTANYIEVQVKEGKSLFTIRENKDGTVSVDIDGRIKKKFPSWGYAIDKAGSAARKEVSRSACEAIEQFKQEMKTASSRAKEGVIISIKSLQSELQAEKKRNKEWGAKIPTPTLKLSQPKKKKKKTFFFL